MPREREAPYVAEGFRNDAEKLLKLFTEKKTLKFSEFAELWRTFNFSTIFMGRECLRELVEFTEECYRNTLLFMDASDIYLKVGAVYMLYSLYLKQPLPLLNSAIQIRFSLKHVFEMYGLENHFLEGELEEHVLDLSFIINKLFKMQAFYICCTPIPMGPVVPIPLLRLEPLRNSSFKEALGSLSMLNDKEIKSVIEITKNYEMFKKMVPFIISTPKGTSALKRFKELKASISEFEDRYNAGLLPTKVHGDVKIEDAFRDLGHRRAMLKAQQYEKAAEVGMSRRKRVSSSDSSPSPPSTPVKRGRGRPRKKPARRGKKKKVAEVKMEPGIGNRRGSGIQDEDVDNPDDPESVRQITGPYNLNNPIGDRRRVTLMLHPRRPSKFPRPVRKHYFDDE